MINKIKRHIAAFGSKFVVAEFVIVMLGTIVVTIVFGSAGRIALAVISLGITLNCLPILIVGAGSLGNVQKKKTVQGQDQQTLNDTLVLSVALLIPFVLVGLTTYELLYAANKA